MLRANYLLVRDLGDYTRRRRRNVPFLELSSVILDACRPEEEFVACYNDLVPSDLNLEELKKRLREGDYLEISTGGGAYEVWAEPLASPPAVYYEGEQHPISELERIAEKIIGEMRKGEIRCRWVEDD